MNAEADALDDKRRVTGARRWLVAYPRAIPLAIFVAIAAITTLAVFSIESNARAREQAQLSEQAQRVANALERRGNGFASYLRAGAALFSSFESVSPQLFRQFVAELRLDVEYRGAEGIGWVEVVGPDSVEDYLARQRSARTGVSDIRASNGEQNRIYAPVTYFAPDNVRNRRALGYDMYSDHIRAAAMALAGRTVRPVASGRVVIAQEDAGRAPGFVIFMPVYREVDGNSSLAGFVYSPFNADRFLEAAMDVLETETLGIRLYDGTVSEDHLLAIRGPDRAHKRSVEQPVTIASREFILMVESSEAGKLAPLSMVTLLFGIAVASLLTLLARLLTRLALEDQARLDFFEEQHSIRNSLSRELNHRVKNTLANVLSIMSLTRRRTNSLDEYADSIEGRVRALSATHDLLTHSDWGTIPVASVVEAELQHFRSAIDHPINISGPAVELAPNDALSFGLALHELATNAAKFGSLSVAGGSVDVTWDLISPDLAEVEWNERGGPPVAEQRSRGFGTELIEKIVAHELRHPVELDFATEGVRCVLRIPVRNTGEFQVRQT